MVLAPNSFARRSHFFHQFSAIAFSSVAFVYEDSGNIQNLKSRHAGVQTRNQFSIFLNADPDAAIQTAGNERFVVALQAVFNILHLFAGQIHDVHTGAPFRFSLFYHSKSRCATEFTLDFLSFSLYNDFLQKGGIAMLYEAITERYPIEKGWSGDRKFKVMIERIPYLLRISPSEKAEQCLRQMRQMEAIAALGIPMCQPVEYGRCEEGVYVLHSWVDGEELEEKLPDFPEAKQYRYGLDAGRILQTLHTIPAPEDTEDWESRFNRKIDRKIAMYEACPLKFEGGEAFLTYLAENRHLLKNRPQCWQHGDYHVGNMMLDRKGTLTIIDFDRDDWGDPWEEFNRIVWCAQTAPAFARGMVDGYFDGAVPIEFWQLLALYICSNTLSSLPWAIPYGEGEIQIMRRQGAEILSWYDGMKKVIPGWYRSG